MINEVDDFYIREKNQSKTTSEDSEQQINDEEIQKLFTRK